MGFIVGDLSGVLRRLSACSLPIVLAAACAQPRERTAPTEELGSVDFASSCAPEVADDLNRAVALFHHMTYPASRDAFGEVIASDPGCAIAYWGAAMTHFQPLWPNRPGPDDLRAGWDLAQGGRRVVSPNSREALYVGSAEAFFDPAGDPEYWQRIDRWAAATNALYEAHPEDPEARALRALSLLATAASSTDPGARHEEAAALLESILDEEPTHPGAVHYLIHANDFAGRERESLDVVRGYASIAPLNPHALHMPTHIFVRLGSWDEVIEWNGRAASAALTTRVGPNGAYVWDEYPHAVEYLVYAQLQKGDDAAALGQIEELYGTRDLQPTFKTAFHYASPIARYALERADWEAAAALTPRTPHTLDWDLFPWPEAIVWFARGLGSAHLRDTQGLLRSLERLETLRDRARATNEAIFANQIEIMRLEAVAWQRAFEGSAPLAIAMQQQAIALEDATPKHPVTPAAIIPARELLGDLYSHLGDYRAALDSYRASDAGVPDRFNTVLGLARASAQLGDDVAARQAYRRLLDLAAQGSDRPAIVEARAFVGGA